MNVLYYVIVLSLIMLNSFCFGVGILKNDMTAVIVNATAIIINLGNLTVRFLENHKK